MFRDTVRFQGMMCCRMLISRACTMTGASGLPSARLRMERCRQQPSDSRMPGSFAKAPGFYMERAD